MDYIRGLEAYQDSREAAITLGKFDGVHRGHQKLIKKVCQLKAKKGVRSVVFAFDMNPLYEKLGKSREGIMSNEERRCLLDEKVDVLLECPFSEDVTSMSAEDFIRKILIEKIHARYIVIGTDFHFGHDKRGDAKMLAEYADVYGYELFVIEKEMYGKREISSSYVREELRKGNMEAVNDMLGYAYTVRGKVEHGRQLGRKLGFPTLNVHPSRDKLLPPNGVYLDSDRICFAGDIDVGAVEGDDQPGDTVYFDTGRHRADCRFFHQRYQRICEIRPELRAEHGSDVYVFHHIF